MPGPVAEAQETVETICKNVRAVVVGFQPQIDLRMGPGKAGKARQQPAGRESGDGADCQHLPVVAILEPAECIAHPPEGIAQYR